MSSQVLSVLPWHEVLFAQWAQRHQSERAAHAYLLIAQTDTGGEALLHAMAASILCDQVNARGQACGECAACALIAAYSHPDLRVLRPSVLDVAHPIEELRPEKPSKEITIEDVRALDNMVNQTSHRGGQRVALLYPAHKLNRNAANALLKTLEEPPANTVFLLLAHDVRQLLPTIVSRCQLLHAPAPSTEQALTYLHAIAPNPNWAQYLQQENNAVLRVAEQVDSGYFTAQQQWIEHLARASDMDVVAVAAQFEKVISDASKARLAGEGNGAVDMAALMTWLQRWLLDLTVTAQHAGDVRYYPRQQAALQRLAARISQPNSAKIHALHQSLASEKRLSDHPLNVRSWIERLLLQYLAVFA